MKTLRDLNLDGFEALRALIQASAYGSLAQAIASLTVFSHPLTVAQTGARAIFPIVRDFKQRGEVDTVGGRLVGFDDNTSPTEAFCWANGWKTRPRDLQFNHVHTRSADPASYTNLANLCVSPSFLAKLTDTDPQIQSLLHFRAFDLFEWAPDGPEKPFKPDNYDLLTWAEPLPPQKDVIQKIRSQLEARKNRTTRMVDQTGWLGDELAMKI